MNKVIKDWVIALCFAIIAALFFRTWFYTPYSIPTSSMSQTIEIGDHIFIDKHTYGFSIPFTEKKIFKNNVSRGDIIVFPYPIEPRIDYVKRVIGIPGDEIQIFGETVFINGEEEDAGYLYFDPKLLTIPENIKTIVPKGKLWVMGDNRRNSKDSRFWGFVDENTVIGKATMIFWSHDPEENIFGGYKLDRIGTIVK
ncbi:MAG: signal peptidase I [Proteobacteria bacterium]|nr:signal peptidase I [Pseudomonadota bacterium]